MITMRIRRKVIRRASTKKKPRPNRYHMATTTRKRGKVYHLEETKENHLHKMLLNNEDKTTIRCNIRASK